MIRDYKATDKNTLYRIYSQNKLQKEKLKDISYTASTELNGFLFGSDTEKEFAETVSNASFIFVYEEESNIAGYCLVGREVYFPEEASNIVWLDPKIKNIYFNDKHSIELHHIVVDASYKKQAIARQLLEKAEKRVKKDGYNYLFSIVPFHPIANYASLRFHVKNRFKKACVTLPIDILGFKNYMSILLYKNL